MRFLRRSTPSQVGADSEPAPEPAQEPGRTPGKGRPTPKRREAQRRRGPVPPPPRTHREAVRYAKANRPDKAERRREAAERRERMEAGDDRYLPVRDRGPVKAHVRDLVDSHRHLAGLFMPAAMVIVITTFTLPDPAVQLYVSIFALSFMALMITEAIFLGRQITARLHAKFPKEQFSAFGIGWYAFTRSTQLRRLRVPKPQVALGADV